MTAAAFANWPGLGREDQVSCHDDAQDCGKTFFARWVQENAKKKGFATAEVQISGTETSLHRLEMVYRRAMEHLSKADCFLNAFRSIIGG